MRLKYLTGPFFEGILGIKSSIYKGISHTVFITYKKDYGIGEEPVTNYTVIEESKVGDKEGYLSLLNSTKSRESDIVETPQFKLENVQEIIQGYKLDFIDYKEAESRFEVVVERLLELLEVPTIKNLAEAVQMIYSGIVNTDDAYDILSLLAKRHLGMNISCLEEEVMQVRDAIEKEAYERAIGNRDWIRHELSRIIHS